MIETRNCPYCERERETRVQPHYARHLTPKGETWVAYCPVCGARTPYTKNLQLKTMHQAKASWNACDLVGQIDPADVPMQTFSPD